MANDHGYIIMSMDWRGMSQYDLPVVLKALVTSPSTIEATRDVSTIVWCGSTLCCMVMIKRVWLVVQYLLWRMNELNPTQHIILTAHLLTIPTLSFSVANPRRAINQNRSIE
jgi:hypothetical protein